MDARMRRIASDYEQIKKDFAGHKNIVVTPIGGEPPEKYHVTYFVNGIYLLEDGRIETLGRHEVEIILHSDYPRYKPICKILTPIWHPNFKGDQICIGDIWGAGESLTDIIINIGDMIQYKSWNSYSPLSADAAQWAMDNRHLFPVGNIDLYMEENKVVKNEAVIELMENDKTDAADVGSAHMMAANPVNDFEITAEELEGIEFISTEQRMQGVAAGTVVKSRINFKTILAKGILWALIGAIVGFCISELSENFVSDSSIAHMMGYRQLSYYYDLNNEANGEFEAFYDQFAAYCEENNINPEEDDAFRTWFYSLDDTTAILDYYDAYKNTQEALYDSYVDEFHSNENRLYDAMAKVSRINTAVWSALIALFIGLFLGIGEGVFYGSKDYAVKYALIGAGISVAIGAVSGYLAQWMYVSMLGDEPTAFAAALVRGLGWAIMGSGIGLSVGLIKPEKKRILFCVLGGGVGAFIGGFLFNFIGEIIPNDMVSRAVAIIIMGLLIGIGVGLLEQFAKQAWLKVIRGEFEGKEYLVFPGTTSIGNNSKNTIVLFKDKLVAPHHCDIVMEGSKYVLVDCGTPTGTVVNGMVIKRHILRQNDAIAIGNSVLVFNTK